MLQLFLRSGSIISIGIAGVADVCPPVLCFRVKFYATDPLRLKEEITRYDTYMCFLHANIKK